MASQAPRQQLLPPKALGHPVSQSWLEAVGVQEVEEAIGAWQEPSGGQSCHPSASPSSAEEPLYLLAPFPSLQNGAPQCPRAGAFYAFFAINPDYADNSSEAQRGKGAVHAT